MVSLHRWWSAGRLKRSGGPEDEREGAIGASGEISRKREASGERLSRGEEKGDTGGDHGGV